MKVKKFTGRDMPDAMKKVRQELGDHAVILTSKTVSTGGFLGLFSRKSIQVIAAVDEEHPSTPVTARSKTREKEPGTYKNESLQESDLEKEVSEIKETLHHLKKDSLLSSSDHPLPLIKVDNALQDHEVEHYIRQETRNTLLMEWYRSEAPDTSSIKKKTKHVLKNAMKGIEFGHSFPPKKFIHLVGPPKLQPIIS